MVRPCYLKVEEPFVTREIRPYGCYVFLGRCVKSVEFDEERENERGICWQ